MTSEIELEPTETKIEIEPIESEIDDLYIDTASYKIANYPADFTLEVLYQKIKNKEIILPDFQRSYVWTKKKASRLIESFLLGLPVPQIFLYKVPESESLLVIDGHQRLKTICSFFDGIWKDNSKFTLLGVKTIWEGKTFTGLEANEQRRFKNYVLRSILFEQTDPKDNRSIFEIFERLNTGGMPLVQQEIRNSMVRGNIIKFLKELNAHKSWRELLDSDEPDDRLMDIEFILRFFALYRNWKNYKRPMKDFITDYMEENKNLPREEIHKLRDLFTKTTDLILKRIGKKAFIGKRGVHVSMLDSIMVAIATLIDKIPEKEDLRAKWKKLITNKVYEGSIAKSTTDTDRVQERIKLALQHFEK